MLDLKEINLKGGQVDKEKNNIAINVLVGESLKKAIDKVSQDTIRNQSQVLRLILQKYFDSVEQGKIDPVK